jgi:hypothetical protein
MPLLPCQIGGLNVSSTEGSSPLVDLIFVLASVRIRNLKIVINMLLKSAHTIPKTIHIDSFVE